MAYESSPEFSAAAFGQPVVGFSENTDFAKLIAEATGLNTIIVEDVGSASDQEAALHAARTAAQHFVPRFSAETADETLTRIDEVLEANDARRDA